MAPSTNVAELRLAGGLGVEELAARLGQQPSARRLFTTLTHTVTDLFGVEPNVAAAIVGSPGGLNPAGARSLASAGPAGVRRALRGAGRAPHGGSAGLASGPWCAPRCPGRLPWR